MKGALKLKRELMNSNSPFTMDIGFLQRWLKSDDMAQLSLSGGDSTIWDGMPLNELTAFRSPSLQDPLSEFSDMASNGGINSPGPESQKQQILRIHSALLMAARPRYIDFIAAHATRDGDISCEQ